MNAQTEARAIDALAEEMRAGLEGVQGGPWHMDKRACYIYAPAERGGDFPLGDNICGGHFNEVMRLRGWGYYTGRGHGALGLDAVEASHRQNLTGQHIARCSPDNIRALLDDRATLTQENAELRGEVERLRREVPSERWYWPEDDTSSDACRDNPREALEYQKPGEIDGYSVGGVAYTNYFGWLPPADDADSDDEFEVDEPTREAAKAKMKAEIERRAQLAALKKEAGR